MYSSHCLYAKDNTFHIKQISRGVTLNVKIVKENNIHQINMQQFNWLQYAVTEFIVQANSGSIVPQVIYNNN